MLAVILRFFSFFPSVIDHDESTYLEIARMLLSGKILYVDMVDIKPPGIFLILAGLQAVFGYSLFVIRLLVALWIGLTAFLVYLTAKQLHNEERSSLAAGIIYIFLISTWSFYGLSITPEIFFNLFTILALYVLLSKQHAVKYFWAGLLAGTGFIIKYLVLFDFTAFMVYMLFLATPSLREKKIPRVILVIILAAAGFLLPFGIMNLLYYLSGHFEDLKNIVYLAPAKYPSAFEPWKMLKYLLDFQLRFLPVFLMFYYVLFRKKFSEDKIPATGRLLVAWLLMALVAVILAGKTFGHYTIQLMLPVSLIAGLLFHPSITWPFKKEPVLSRKTGFVIIAVLIVAVSAMKIEYMVRKDVPAEIADYLRPKLGKEDNIYTGNYHHIIYYLLKKDSPTKYVHRSLLLSENHIRALNINAAEEFRQIMDRQPAYIIVRDEFPDSLMNNYIHINYIVEKEFEGGVYLYARKR